VLEYALQTSRKTGEGIKYNTARSFQSAASAYHLWEKMLQFTTNMYRDKDKNVIGASHLPPTYIVIATLGNKGMRRCIGTETRPS
jgi:phosphomannomutase